jgi:hypothetical protein
MTAKKDLKASDGPGPLPRRRGSPALSQAAPRGAPQGSERGRETRDRATIARLAAHVRWARVRNRSAATAAARAAADDRFIAEARRFHPGLSEEEILKRAGNLRSAHAIRAARARWDGTRRKARGDPT